MSGFLCKSCSQIMSITTSTLKEAFISFDFLSGNKTSVISKSNNYFELNIYKCPNCGYESVNIIGHTGQYKGKQKTIFPESNAKLYPSYVPEAIRKDYEEAYAILELSPKASATLSRRCLQGIIRDFYGVTKQSLFKEIEEIKSLVPTDLWNAIDGLRKIGNIGAHMEKDINLIVDIDSNEAEKLIKLIEIMIDSTYIARHKQQELYNDIIAISDEKQSEKNN